MMTRRFIPALAFFAFLATSTGLVRFVHSFESAPAHHDHHKDCATCIVLKGGLTATVDFPSIAAFQAVPPVIRSTAGAAIVLPLNEQTSAIPRGPPRA